LNVYTCAAQLYPDLQRCRMSSFRLTEDAIAALEGRLRETKDASAFRRLLAVLEVARGRSVSEVAAFLRTSRVSVHHWLVRYRQSGDPGSLLDHRGGNRPTLWSDDLEALLRDSLAHPPDFFGYEAVEWTVPLLREHLTCCWGVSPSATTLRRELHRLDYVWKRPRYRLLPDPQREKKTAAAQTAGIPGATHRRTFRGRDRFVAVPPVAKCLGQAWPAGQRGSERCQRPQGGLRHD